MTDQPPPLKDPFAIEPDDSSASGASSARAAGQMPILRDPFGRERTPIPLNRPQADQIPTWQGSTVRLDDVADDEPLSVDDSTSPKPESPASDAPTSAPAAASPAASVPAEASADANLLSGRELTMVGPEAPAGPDSVPAAVAGGRLHLQVMPGAVPGSGRPFPGTAGAGSRSAGMLPGGAGDQLTGRELTMPGLGAAPASSSASDLTGRELTMPGLGAAPAASSASDLTGRELTMPGLGAAPAVSSSDDWLGRELTMPGLGAASSGDLTGRELTMPGLGAAPAASPADDWLGRELTMPGPGGADSADLLTGRELTMPGTPAAPQHQADSPERTPRTIVRGDDATQAMDSSGRPKTFGGKPRTGATSVAFNDAWHMQGRQGAFTGQTWGDWEIGGILGEGGMGAVYRGKQRSLNRRVALKVLAPNLAADSKLLQRFQLEARMTSMLSSPNVVQVFAAGEWEDNHFFVMEYVEGRDLYDVIKDRKAENKPFTADEAADVVIQAAKGLAEAGRHGIVHRDIKPPNLMVTKGGLVKVADFGIVKVMGESSLTMAGQAVGTPSYVSPEQGRGEADIDQRSDLYSLGVVFYELMCGKKPFEGTTPNAIIYQHCYGEPELPRQINVEISEVYQAVVLKCLQKKPEHRYQSALELIADLESIRNGNMLQSALANFRQGTGADEAKRENMSWAQRHLLKLVAAAVVILLLGGAGIMTIKHRLDVEKAKEEDLRQGLVALDQAVSLPPNVDDRLRDLAAVVSDHDDNPDVQRWRTKVAHVRGLAESLKLVDGGVLTAVQRVTAQTTLDGYVREVGAADQDALRWADVLERIQLSEDDLRNVFRRAETEALDLPRRTLLAEPLARLAALVPDSDAQVRKWGQVFREFDDQVKGLVESLSKLDALPKITEGDRQSFGQILVRAKPLLGAEDERIVRWQDLLAKSRSRVDGYRAAIKERLAKEDQPSKQSQEAIKSDLVALRALVDAKDADLVAWDEQIAAANAVYDGLKKELAKLDELPKEETLELALIQPTADSLARLKLLALPGDADLRRWEERVQMSRDHLADLRERLKPLDGVEPLSLAQQAALAEAMERFAAKGALDADVRKEWRKRLDDEAARVVALRQELVAFAQLTAISPAMREGLERLGKDVGDADPDVQAWRAKLARVDALRAQLAVLDQPTGTPLDIDIPLARLRDEIGDENAEMVRWTPKVKRLKDADVALHPLDTRAPLPVDAAANLAVLREIAGEQNPTYARRQGKFDRIGTLKSALARLPITYAQSPQANQLAHAQFSELRTLVGDADADLPAWADRIAVLDGPGQPSWAGAYGRDDFGVWADLAIGTNGKTTQRFRFVPPGDFLRGSPDGEAYREDDEVLTRITLTKAFWLAENECTQEVWQAVMGGVPSRDHGALRPVERVSWDDCQGFIATLAQSQHVALRLPSESEWEYACRAGSLVSFASAVPGESSVDKIAWFAGNSRGQSEEVKLRFPNTLGLYDMQGNVWEWCQDGYSAYSTALVIDPIGNGSETHIVRGGSWGDSGPTCRAANRASLRPSVRSTYVGLRLAADVEWLVKPDGRTQLMSGAEDARQVTQTLEFGSQEGLHLRVMMSMPKPIIVPVAPAPIVPAAAVPADAPVAPAVPTAEVPAAPAAVVPVPVAADPTAPAAAVPAAPTDAPAVPVVPAADVPAIPAAVIPVPADAPVPAVPTTDVPATPAAAVPAPADAPAASAIPTADVPAAPAVVPTADVPAVPAAVVPVPADAPAVPAADVPVAPAAAAPAPADAPAAPAVPTADVPAAPAAAVPVPADAPAVPVVPAADVPTPPAAVVPAPTALAAPADAPAIPIVPVVEVPAAAVPASIDVPAGPTAPAPDVLAAPAAAVVPAPADAPVAPVAEALAAPVIPVEVPVAPAAVVPAPVPAEPAAPAVPAAEAPAVPAVESLPAPTAPQPDPGSVTPVVPATEPLSAPLAIPASLIPAAANGADAPSLPQTLDVKP